MLRLCVRLEWCRCFLWINVELLSIHSCGRVNDYIWNHLGAIQNILLYGEQCNVVNHKEQAHDVKKPQKGKNKTKNRKRRLYYNVSLDKERKINALCIAIVLFNDALAREGWQSPSCERACARQARTKQRQRPLDALRESVYSKIRVNL